MLSLSSPSAPTSRARQRLDARHDLPLPLPLRGHFWCIDPDHDYGGRSLAGPARKDAKRPPTHIPAEKWNRGTDSASSKVWMWCSSCLRRFRRGGGTVI